MVSAGQRCFAECILPPDWPAAKRSIPGRLGLGLAGQQRESYEAPVASIWLVRGSHCDLGSLHVGNGGEGEGEAAQASLGGRGAGLREV